MKEIGIANTFKHKRLPINLNSSLIEVIINRWIVRSNLINGDIIVNVIASWFIREVRLEPTWPSLFCFEAIDQRNIKSLDLIANLLIIVNNIIVNIDFYVFEITNWSQSYSIIWDQSYLWEVNAINY